MLVSPYSNGEYTPFNEMSETLTNFEKVKCRYSSKIEKILLNREQNKTEMRITKHHILPADEISG